MGRTKQALPVKLIVGMFSREETLLSVAKGALMNRFGPVDYESELLYFDQTPYYEREFGPNLLRRFVSFSELIAPDRLAEVKCITNELEMTWTVDGRRQVNLDPGYVSMGKLVLATTKDYTHRIYLGQGIYAEVTLKYQRGAFRPWEWTYPDYASPEYLQIFGRIRQSYVDQLHSQG
jgi:hypothetical protein